MRVGPESPHPAIHVKIPRHARHIKMEKRYVEMSSDPWNFRWSFMRERGGFRRRRTERFRGLVLHV
jgi:hypothetical protein